MHSIRHHHDLRQFLHQGCRSRDDWRLGLEYELFVTDDEGRAIPWDGEVGVERLLQELSETTGWRPTGENGRVLGLDAGDGRSVTLEPGAQLEFNTSPCLGLNDIKQEFDNYLQALESVGEKFGFRFLALGAQPKLRPDEIKRIPKRRYDILEPWLAQTDELGLWMMKATCGMQVNFDHDSVADALRKLRLCLRLSPILNAMFANSGLAAGRASGFASWRGHVWTRTDPNRCGLIEPCLKDDSSFDDYISWACAASMLFVERGDELIDKRGISFDQFLKTGEACWADWELHLSTLFPEARLRPQLELRSVDSGTPEMAMALCGLVKGLFYSPSALEEVEALLPDDPSVYPGMLNDGHRLGLSAMTPDGKSFLELAKEIMKSLSLPEEEQQFLAPLNALLDRGESAGESTQEQLRGDWGGEIQQIVDASSLFLAKKN